jgi:hypothetical protein
MLKTSNMKKNLNYEMSLDVQYEILFIITPYIRMLDSDWLIAVIFFCFTNFVTSVSVKGKNGKYDCYIKRTTDNV